MDMLKSWLISLLVLFALVLAVYLGLFDLLARRGAKIAGVVSVLTALTAAYIILSRSKNS